MSIKEEENNMEVIGLIDDDVDDLGNVIQEYNQKYKRIWPLHIYPCQKIDFFGVKFMMFHFSSPWITDVKGCFIFTFAY